MVTHTADRREATRRVLTSGLVLVMWGVGTGLVLGLGVVQVLGRLGLHVDTGAGTLLRRAFTP